MRTRLIGFIAMLAVVMTVCGLRADVIDVDVTQVDAQYQSAFKNAEKFWETRIIGYSDALPGVVKAQLSKLRIVASTANLDGPGGILGQAGPTNTIVYGGFGGFPFGGQSTRIEIATRSTMQFDLADMAGLQAAGNLEAVIRHEMAHAMGFGGLWGGNGLVSNSFNGQTNYVGKYGLAAYRKEAGKILSPFVPIEQQGGPGTALVHWEDGDTFFNQVASTGKTEGMLGSIDAFNPSVNTFWSETTWAQFADLWFKVRGVAGVPFNDFAIGPPTRPVSPWTPRAGGGIFRGGSGGGTGGILGGAFMIAVPEPSSFGLLAIGSMMLLRRRRR